MATKLVSGNISEECWQRFRAVNDTKDILAGKWKVMIVGSLASGKKRYLELQRVVEGIGTKMLSKELQELELKSGTENINDNLITCYQKLIDINVVGKEEMNLLKAWISDLSKLL